MVGPSQARSEQVGAEPAVEPVQAGTGGRGRAVEAGGETESLGWFGQAERDTPIEGATESDEETACGKNLS